MFHVYLKFLNFEIIPIFGMGLKKTHTDLKCSKPKIKLLI